jgi:hypothetical protein
VLIAWRQQCKGGTIAPRIGPKDRWHSSALLLLPLLATPPKNKGVAEQWQWRAKILSYLVVRLINRIVAI